MLDLTFGEQVKIILKRKGMTIKELAKLIEESKNNSTDYDEDDYDYENDNQGWGPVMGGM